MLHTEHPNSVGIHRRRTLEFALVLILGAGAGAPLATAQQQHEASEACPINVGTHGMLVFGQRSVFLSHLPMFVDKCEDGKNFLSEHRFQLILNATFEGQRTRSDATDLYRQDRQQNPQMRMYSLNPRQAFALAEIFGPPASRERRRSFPADVFRGHFERGGSIISGLRGATVQITRVVYTHEFLPLDRKSDSLEYVLFGTPGELFLAHRIVAPGDFDQILPVRVLDQPLSDAELGQELVVVVSGRPNQSSSRLRDGQNASAQLLRKDAPAQTVALQALQEIYFEESELAMPPIADTQEERDAGF